MTDTDLDFFQLKHIHRGEHILSSIDCKNAGNPFPGTLILTEKRLIFVRQASPGAEMMAFRLTTLDKIDYQIANGMDFMLILHHAKFAHHFHVLGIDNAKRRAFAEQAQAQFEIKLAGKPVLNSK